MTPRDVSGVDGLERFVDAQAASFGGAASELKAGRKSGHWMWHVFPQLRGLGSSANAAYYGLASLDEARRYLAHPVLGDRLRRCVGLVLDHRGRPLRTIFAPPDDLKFRSCMTLFRLADSKGPGSIFSQTIAAFCDGESDPITLDLLDGQSR